MTTTVRLSTLNDFTEWRAQARQLLVAGVPPEAVAWVAGGLQEGLFEAAGSAPFQASQDQKEIRVPSAFPELATLVLCHADRERFALLYRLLWRLQDDRHLLEVRSDPDVRRLERMAAAVRRDAHKMKAFLRFKTVRGEGGRERYAAWFEPDHYVVERVAPFLARRFAGMDWAVVTPYRTALWNGETLGFAPGGRKADVPAQDALEGAWKTYFSSIFNPARLKVAMMKSEMPVKYWRNLPEAELIPSLIDGASQRVAEMIVRPATTPPVRHMRQSLRSSSSQDISVDNDINTLADAKAAIGGCTRCPLYEMATQPVFGEGPSTADVMFVGEQPGDQEDLEGKPFVGPAGKVFDAALQKVGIDRGRAYVTNAVKHFKFVPRGKRRLHQRPNGGEIAACRFWLDLERDKVRPKLVVALGATAVSALLERPTTLSSVRGRPLDLEDGSLLFATVHPSYLLRIRDSAEKARESERFEDDLKRVKALMDELKGVAR